MSDLKEAREKFYDEIGGTKLKEVNRIVRDISPEPKDMVEYPDLEAVISSKWPVLDDDEGLMLTDWESNKFCVST